MSPGARRSRVGTDVDHAVSVLRAGGLVGLPTETVYGLAADATKPAAVGRIFSVKGRPADHPLIVHLADSSLITRWAFHVPAAGAVLASTCWPGPLTLLLPRHPRVLDVVTGGRPTIGLRVPAHPLALDLLARFGDGLAAPSANRFGRVSPTTAQHVLDDLGSDVDYVLDGGACPVGVESTIVDCTVDPPQVLRTGVIGAEEIESILGATLAPAAGPSRAAGMLASHYAPDCRVLLADTLREAEAIAASQAGAGRVEILAGSGHLADDARSLYARLRDADRRGVDVLVAVLPPPAGLGHAIRDRLTKAAAPTRP